MSGAAIAAAEPPPLSGAKLWVTAMALALGTFVQVLDGTIANVSLPTIAGNLGVSTDSGTWVITSFAVANGVTLPLTGWLMARFGVVRTFCSALLAFTFASVLCGLAWNLSSLVVFRILQGAVSGPLIPGSQALLLMIFPPAKRGLALAIWAMTTLIGPVLGPVLGGYISDNYHWGWIFLVNLPIGLIAAWLSWTGLRGRETPTRKLPIDTVGLLLLAFWVFSLQVVLDLGKDRDWFNNPMIVLLSVCAGVGFLAWLIWELTDEHPAVDLSLFKRRNFAMATMAVCLGYSLLFGVNLLVPLWLQQQLGYTASWAGLVAAPSGVIAFLATPIVGRFRNIDARMVATVAFVSFALSYFMRAHFTADVSFTALIMPQLLQGLGMATFFVPLLTVMLDGVPASQVPAASGLSNFARITCGSFAASLTTTFWARRETLHQTRLVERANPFSPAYQQAVDQMQAHGMTAAQANGSIMRSVINQAFLLSTTDLFWLFGWMTAAMIGFVWLTRRPAPSDHVVAAD